MLFNAINQSLHSSKQVLPALLVLFCSIQKLLLSRTKFLVSLSKGFRPRLALLNLVASLIETFSNILRAIFLRESDAKGDRQRHRRERNCASRDQ